MLCYCNKCGRIVQEYDKNPKCDYCQNSLLQVPNEYTIGGVGTAIDKDLKEQFINEYIKSSPEFDQYLFEHRDEYLYNRRRENEAKIAHGKAILEEKNRVPKCPSCGSSNISKIGLLNRAISFEIAGFASSKISKTHKCNHCGTTW